MSQDRQVVNCGNSLCIAHVADLLPQFRDAVINSSSIEINASEVERVDVAGLQLIVSLIKEIEKTDGNFSWSNPSEVLKDAGITLGLSHIIGLG